MKFAAMLALLLGVSQNRSFAQASNRAFDELSKRAAAALGANPAEAADLYRQAVALDPSWTEGWFYLGATRYQTGQFAEARAAFQRAVALAPDRGTVWAFLGLTELRLSLSADGLSDIRKGEALGLANDPKFITSVRNQAALTYIKAADFAGAVEQLLPLARQSYAPELTQPALGVAVLGISQAPSEVVPDKLPLVNLVGETAWNLYGQKGDAAITLSKELIEKYPNEHGVHYLRGICLVHSDPAGARLEFRSEVRLSPAYAPARLQLAMLDMEAGNMQDAAELSKAAVRLQPNSTLNHVILGRSLLGLKQTTEAIAELEAAVKLSPENPRTHFFLEQAYRQAGRTNDAIQQKREFNRLKSTVDPLVIDYDDSAPAKAPQQ